MGIDYSINDTPSFEGVGPAIVESRKIFFQGKKYEEDLSEFLKRQLPDLDTIKGVSYGSLDPGTVLPSGNEVYMIANFGNMDGINLIAAKVGELDAYPEKLK